MIISSHPIPSLETPIETPMEHEVEQKEEGRRGKRGECRGGRRGDTPPIVQVWIRPYFCMLVYILARVAL